MIIDPSRFPAIRVGMLGVFLFSLLIIWWLDRDREWGHRIRTRLILGVPWGTLITIIFVLCVYGFLQSGWTNWHRPVTIPFRSWSYLYPLGTATAAFAHNGPNHLTGNLIATLVLGTLAEFAWGHFPTQRGTTVFRSWRTHPYVRAFLLFPGGVFVIGLLTSLFSWGPIIGFSGVVFAFAGFAFPRYPIITIVALEADDVVRITYRALRDPVLVSKAEPQFVEPWWAGIAVQGHLLGLFLGLVLGAIAFRRHETSAGRLWAATLILATSFTLWALWWFRGNQEFVLLRALGVSFVLLLALLVTLALRAQRANWRLMGVPSRQVGILLLVFPILVVGMVAVPLNLTSVGNASPPGETAISVQDYTVTYAENVTNQQTSVINLTVLGETTDIQTSGVIVISDSRHLWTQAFATSRLKFAGRGSVVIGGVGWRETVRVRRDGWEVAGNRTAYRVWLRPPDEEWRLAYRSLPATADAVLAGARVSIRPEPDNYTLVVSQNGTVTASHSIPQQNETVSTGHLAFVRENNTIYSRYNASKIPIAELETYEGQQS